MTVREIPIEIDYSEFKWLRKGDRQKIAVKTNMSVSMVRHTLKKREFNPDILAAALDVVIENKKKVMERQMEAKRLSQVFTQ